MRVESTGGCSPALARDVGGRWDAEPALPGLALTDAEALALASSLALVDGQVRVANDKIRTAACKREGQIDRAWKALQNARRQARKKSGWGTFGSICRAIGIGASIAAAASTGGSSLVLTAALLAASMSARSVLGRLNLDRELVQIKGVKINVSDAVVIGAAVGGGCSAGGSEKLTAFQKAVAIGSRGVQSGASAGQAVATERVGHYEARTIELEADSRAHENAAAREQRTIEASLSRLRENLELRARAIEAVMSIQETKDQALKALVGRRA